MSSLKRCVTASLLVLCCVFALTASVPNVPAGTWQSWGNMSVARQGAASVRLLDGRVLIIGGSDANGPLASVEVFGNDGVFSGAQPMHSARSGHAAIALSDGRVLVSGGVMSGGGVTNGAEVYDPTSDSWTVLSVPMVDARAGHTASLLVDGRVVLAGGHDLSGNALSSVEVFDPINEAFTSAGAMSSPRMDHTAATLGDGRVFLIGGSDGANTLNSVDIYDPVAGSVMPGPALSMPRSSATATTTLDGKIIVIGGNNGSADLASIETYDSFVGSFALSTASLTTPRSGHQAFLLPNNNSVLIVGGTSAGADLSSADLYQPWADAAQATGVMGSTRPGMSGSALNMDGLLLAVGGTTTSTELYGFPTVKTDQVDYPPGTIVTITGGGWQPGETVTLTLVESPDLDTHPVMTAVADANGNIVNTEFSPDLHDLDIRFYLTAVGSASGRQAQNTFTDSNRQIIIDGFSITSPLAATDNTMNVSQSVNVHLVFHVNGGNWTNVGAILSVPADWSKTPDLSGLSIANTTSRTFDWNVISSSGPSSGSISVSVNGTVANPDNCQQCPVSSNFNATAVNPASLSVTSMTAAKTVGGGTTAKTGDAITVTMVVANAAGPRATATSVAPSLLTVNAFGATGTCSASGTTAASILGGGTRTYTYSCTVTGGNGTLSFTGSAAGTDENSLAAVNSGTATTNTITVDNTAPAPPSTPDLTAASDSGALDTDNITNIQKPTFTGTAEAGTSVTLLVDGTPNGTAVTDGAGNWSVTAVNNITNGTRSVTATATDAANNVSSPSGTLSITIDTTANPPSTPDLDPASDSGALDTDNITNITTPKFKGTAEPNASVEVFRGGTTSLGTTTADGSGNWSLTVGSALADATYSITAKQTDVAGNISNASGALSLTIDTLAPSIPTAPNLSPSDDTGILNNDNITNKTANLNLTGSGDPSVTVALFEGVTQLGTTTSNSGSGNWTIVAAGPFTPGSHNFTAKATDTAGNTSNASAPHTVVIDTTAPSVTINQAAGQVDPAVVGPINFTVVFSEATTNFATGDVALSGTAGATTATVTGSGTTYNVSVTGMTSAGTVIASVNAGVATDTAGNGNTASTSTDNSVTYNPDNKAPVVTISFATPDGQNGWFVHSPVGGTVSANDTTTGNSNVTAISCTDGVTPLAVGSLSGIGTTSASGSISVSGEGTHNIACTATDSAGNTGAFTDSTTMPVMIKIDTQAPTTSCGAADGLWHAADVTIACTASDPGGAAASGLASPSDASFNLTTSVAAGTEDSNASTSSHQVCDEAGNCSTGGPVTGNKVDKKAPSLSCGSGDGNWHPADVTIACTANDSGSGLGNLADASFNLTTNVPANNEDPNASTGSHPVCDAVGNCSTAGPVMGNKVDKKAPVQQSCQSPDTAWHGTDVALKCTYADGGSGPTSQDVSLTTNVPAGSEDGNAVASANGAKACDAVGNCAASPADIPGNKIDKKAPQQASCDSPDTAWHGTDVALKCTYADGGSGPTSQDVSLTTNVPAGSEDGNAVASANGAKACDAVGNCAASPADIPGNKIDKKPPVVSCGSADGQWHANDVSIGCTATDGGSGLANSGDASFSLSTSVPAGTETNNASTGSHSVMDAVGNSATGGPITGNWIDKKAPQLVSCDVPDTLWHATDVTLQCHYTDGGSGPPNQAVNLSTNVPTNTETSNATASANGAKACDAVSNCATSPTDIPSNKVDKKAPTITFASRLPAANGYGWNNTNVAVTWSCSDGGSDAVAATVSDTKTAEGQNQTANGACTDNVGNSSSASVNGISIDKTLPTLSPTVSPNPVLLNGTATANPGASDSLSGIATSSCASLVLNSVGLNKSVNCTTTDKAGNSNSVPAYYSVVYASGGLCLGDIGHAILQPINADGTSVFKQKSTVPMKFRVCDANGNSIGTAGVVANMLMGQSLGTIADIDETIYSTTPDNTFRWDPTGQQWIFNFGTKTLSSNATYYFQLLLNDGSSINYKFGLR